MKKLFDKFVLMLGSIKFGSSDLLTHEDKRAISAILNQGNYFILIQRKFHLTTFLISAGHFLKTGRWGKWSHALLNIETLHASNYSEHKLLEAVGAGVKFSDFDEVFTDCSAVMILRPRVPAHYGEVAWECAIGTAIENIGKGYDTKFDYADSSKVSCIELCSEVMKSFPDADFLFHGFFAMVKNEKQMTPDMLVECGSMESLLIIRR